MVRNLDRNSHFISPRFFQRVSADVARTYLPAASVAVALAAYLVRTPKKHPRTWAASTGAAATVRAVFLVAAVLYTKRRAFDFERPMDWKKVKVWLVISVPHGVVHGVVFVKRREKSNLEVKHQRMTRSILISCL